MQLVGASSAVGISTVVSCSNERRTTVVIIGVDQHKASHTATALDPVTNSRVASVRVDATLAGYRRLLRWAGPSRSGDGRSKAREDRVCVRRSSVRARVRARYMLSRVGSGRCVTFAVQAVGSSR